LGRTRNAESSDQRASALTQGLTSNKTSEKGFLRKADADEFEGYCTTTTEFAEQVAIFEETLKGSCRGLENQAGGTQSALAVKESTSLQVASCPLARLAKVGCHVNGARDFRAFM
jgi:hypothetical protein